VARLQTGHLRIRLQWFDLVELVERVVAPYRPKLMPGQELKLEHYQAPAPVLADPDRLQQVLINLLDNSIKYSPSGGLICLIVQTDNEGYTIDVADEGMGLPPGSGETIFQPFGRATNAASSEIQGMGLGLYVCRQIMESHGGWLTADSAGENQGTRMRLWLPASASVATSSNAPPVVVT
jgi:signal transduction histidine kinase